MDAKGLITGKLGEGDVYNNQLLTARVVNARTAKIRWQLKCQGCGSVTTIDEDRLLGGYRCAASICLGDRRVPNIERRQVAFRPEQQYAGTLRSELRDLQLKEAKQAADSAQAAQAKAERLEKERGAKAEKQAAENTRRAVEAFKAYHRVDPPARAKIAADYVRSRGFSQDTTGVQAALRELNDEDLKQQILREE